MGYDLNEPDAVWYRHLRPLLDQWLLELEDSGDYVDDYVVYQECAKKLRKMLAETDEI